jgi:SOS-response transcriptional repressor LexA
MNRAAGDSHPIFTPRQGQYLAFIHAYTLVNGRPPAQADIQRFFQVSPPSVHEMLLTLERERLISRRPGMARSIVVLVDRADLPPNELVAGLLALQAEYAGWYDALPDSLRDTVPAAALLAVVEFDLDELGAIVPPRGYGRD